MYIYFETHSGTGYDPFRYHVQASMIYTNQSLSSFFYKRDRKKFGYEKN